MKLSRVMIVEDDTIMLFLQKKLVIKEKLDLSPLTFMNGRRALDFLLSPASGEGSFLILLDINMPVMNGWEFLDALSGEEAASRVKVVVITSSVDRADREKAFSYPLVVDYKIKPLLNLAEIKGFVE